MQIFVLFNLFNYFLMNDCSIICLDQYRHFNKSGGVKLVLLSQTPTLSEMMLSCKCFQHVNQMPTLSYMHVNSIIIKNAIILNIKHNKFKFCEIYLVPLIQNIIVICLYILCMFFQADMTPIFVTIFSHLKYFSDYLGYSITSEQVFNKSNNWKVGK